MSCVEKGMKRFSKGQVPPLFSSGFSYNGGCIYITAAVPGAVGGRRTARAYHITYIEAPYGPKKQKTKKKKVKTAARFFPLKNT